MKSGTKFCTFQPGIKHSNLWLGWYCYNLNDYLTVHDSFGRRTAGGKWMPAGKNVSDSLVELPHLFVWLYNAKRYL